MLLRLFPIAFWIFSLLLGCTTPNSNLANSENPPGGSPQERVFRDSYESIWRACQISLTRYPIQINDMDAGVLETDYIKGDIAWMSPHWRTPQTGGRRYKLNIRVLKGKLKGESGTKVIVSKRIESQKDFFSPLESETSDGLEETSVLYRIAREIEITRFLKKVKK